VSAGTAGTAATELRRPGRWRGIGTLTRAELALTVRRGESVLLTLVIPVTLLVFLSQVPLLPTADRSVNRLLPGLAALSVLSTAMVGLGIATAFERQQGVLKLLGVTPVTRGGWLAAKLGAVLTVEALQLAILTIVAALLGWRPGGRVWLTLPAVLAGTAAFAGIGLVLAGRLRAETTLAAANGLYVLLLLGGGLIAPLNVLPGVVAAVAELLPAAPLTELLVWALGSGRAPGAGHVVVLAVWAVAAPLAAARLFRWQPG
jgi:ABC-2 type transport system permease protein